MVCAINEFVQENKTHEIIKGFHIETGRQFHAWITDLVTIK